MIYEHGSLKIDTDTLPATSIAALLSAGLSHSLSNVVASKVTAQIRKLLANGGKASDVTKEQVSAWRGDISNGAQLDTWTAEGEAAVIKSMMDGTMGVRAAGIPREPSDPLAAAAYTIAKAEVVKIFTSVGITKLPKGAEPITFGPLSLPLSGWIERRLANAEAGPRIAKEAAKKVADHARLVAKTKETKTAGGESPEAYGL